MKTLSLLLLLLPVACKGSPETDGPDDSGAADTDTPVDTPVDTSEDPEESDDPDEPEDTGASGDSSEPDDTNTEPEAGANALPDFSLIDVNDTSPTASERVSPRDYLEKVSGWYFTHAT